jgi:hypothetical protein
MRNELALPGRPVAGRNPRWNRAACPVLKKGPGTHESRHGGGIPCAIDGGRAGRRGSGTSHETGFPRSRHDGESGYSDLPGTLSWMKSGGMPLSGIPPPACPGHQTELRHAMDYRCTDHPKSVLPDHSGNLTPDRARLRDARGRCGLSGTGLSAPCRSVPVSLTVRQGRQRGW